MSAAADARGLKRICTECGARFYDFNKRPIVCPACGAEFTGEPKVKGRRGRVTEEAEKEKPKEKPAEAEAPATNDEAAEAGDDEVVSLDDVKDMEDAAEDKQGEEEIEEDLGKVDDLGAGIEEGLDDDLDDDLDVKVSKDDE